MFNFRRPPITEKLEIVQDGKLIIEYVVYNSKGVKQVIYSREYLIVDKIKEIDTQIAKLQAEKAKLQLKKLPTK